MIDLYHLLPPNYYHFSSRPVCISLKIVLVLFDVMRVNEHVKMQLNSYARSAIFCVALRRHQERFHRMINAREYEKLYLPLTISQRRIPLVFFDYRVGCLLDSVWTWWRRDETFSWQEVNPDNSVHSQTLQCLTSQRCLWNTGTWRKINTTFKCQWAERYLSNKQFLSDS